MISLGIQIVAEMLQADVTTDQLVDFEGCCIDSRQVQPGHLFFAISGERFDGHAFVEAAKQAGAVAAVVSKRLPIDLPQLIVASPEQALGQLAQAWRSYCPAKLIAVTGSNGKTTVKDMIYSILKVHAADDSTTALPSKVLATSGNLNNHLGVPLTLLQLSPQHRYAVVEMGMNHFGEIAYLTNLAKPQVALITNAAASHLAGVGDVAGVAKAKAEIFQGLDEDGMAILNRDDRFFSDWQQCLTESQAWVSFGLSEDAMLRAKCYNLPPFTGEAPKTPFQLLSPDGCIEIDLPLLGQHNVLNALAAASAVWSIGVPLPTIKQGLEAIALAPGRIQMQRAALGCVILNDSYNANPFSLSAALDVLAAYQSEQGRRILVLGDMGELGESAVESHRQAGKLAREKAVDQLFCLGDLTENTVEAFGAGACSFSDVPSLLAALKKTMTATDCILVKGSRSMKMERVVNALIEE